MLGDFYEAVKSLPRRAPNAASMDPLPRCTVPSDLSKPGTQGTQTWRGLQAFTQRGQWEKPGEEQRILRFQEVLLQRHGLEVLPTPPHPNHSTTTNAPRPTTTTLPRCCAAW